MIRGWAVAPALLLLTACGGGGGSTSTPTPLLSGIDPYTVQSPTCPVQREGQNCSAPFSATVVVTQNGKTVARVTTSSNGRGHIPLPPGTYTVSGEASNKPFPRPEAPQQVTVEDGEWVHLQVAFDTGIR